MTVSLKVPIEKLREEPYASILCYPRPGKRELSYRINQLRKLHIDALEFAGGRQIFNLAVLGKGFVGIVTIAYRNQQRFALKIRRIDADRSEMRREAQMLKLANSVDVGPRFLSQSKDFLLMQFIDGQLLPEWLENKTAKPRIRKILRETLEQCWRLDKVGLDHGELSHAPKHVIIDKRDKVFVLDFETASADRKPANVTSISQFLFISGLARNVAQKLGRTRKEVAIHALRRYKNARTRENFEKVLEACGV
jgi:putative serine/threonine protein kinase